MARGLHSSPLIIGAVGDDQKMAVNSARPGRRSVSKDDQLMTQRGILHLQSQSGVKESTDRGANGFHEILHEREFSRTPGNLTEIIGL